MKMFNNPTFRTPAVTALVTTVVTFAVLLFVNRTAAFVTLTSELLICILGFVSAKYFYENFNYPEGELTKHRAAKVCENALCMFAKELEIGPALRLGKGEMRMGGSERPSILADAFEAVLAAVYLDGGLDEASKIVLRFIPRHDALEEAKDYKTILQEIIQRNREEKVEYFLKSQTGPDHNRVFVIQVMLNSNVIGTGEGHSKKQAEQMAAKEALELMGYKV